jgi:hypothetical protein
MRLTTAITDNVFDFDYLLHPGAKFEHPQDVVSHPGLSIGEKRAILSSWPPTPRRSRPVPRCGRRSD